MNNQKTSAMKHLYVAPITEVVMPSWRKGLMDVDAETALRASNNNGVITDQYGNQTGSIKTEGEGDGSDLAAKKWGELWDVDW